MEDQIKELDRLVAWGAKNGRITGKLLEGFQGVIKNLVKFHDKTESFETERDIRLRLAHETMDKLKLICRKTGLTEKSIEEMMGMEDEFLENYPYTVHSDMDYQIMRSCFRNIDVLVKGDMTTLALHEEMLKLKRRVSELPNENGGMERFGVLNTINEKVEKMLSGNIEMFEHLIRFMKLIENGELKGIRGGGEQVKKAEAEIREYHLMRVDRNGGKVWN